MIPAEKIEEIRSRADIVDVVSGYVALKRRGANHLGLCPFHNEKTPSFTVNEDKGIFYCFGCGAGGNVISFLMKHERMEFPETVRALAERYGIKIVEQKRSAKSEAAKDERERIKGLNRLALGYFSAELNGPGGSSAREYIEKRGFSAEVVESFRLGFAPSGWEGLTGFLRKKGVNLDLSVKAGLLGKKEDRYYDRFRGRLIFPITDQSGSVVAFGARSLDGSEPKYLNSPESALFKKAETLYGLFKAKDSIRKEGAVIVVEGYFDLLALYSAGFANCVATMGTALTPAHLRRLKRYGVTVYLLFDGDEAGTKAALRGLPHFIEESVPARVVTLPEGSDPDDFLKLEGAPGLKKALKEALPLMEFFLLETQKRCDLKTGQGKGAFFDEVAPLIARIDNVAERGHYVAIASTTLGLEPKEFYDSMGAGEPGAGAGSGAGSVGIFNEERRPHATRLAEATLLRVLLRHPELFSTETAEALLLFKDPFLAQVASSVALSLKDGAFNAQSVLDSIEDEEVRGFIAKALVVEDRGFVESPERMAKDCIDKVLMAGKPRGTKKELLKRLDEGGRTELAREIMAGAKTPPTKQ